ncbi:MAG: hypothetical protein AUJ75_01730 [Candidatus Omnitrophica bacterium CG1_02_49_10]|nr:MAG: hypothetical protein AUJ75_01730 [Candidatus Omnitrophica bacterium CG1_02_49_10]
MENANALGIRQPEILREASKGVSILESIMKHGPISKGEISRRTGFNIVTISNYVDRFLDEKIIFEKGLDVSTGGRRPVIVDMNPKYGFIIGVDVNTDNIIAAASNFDCKIIKKIKRERGDMRLDNAIEASMDSVREVISQSGLEKSKFKAVTFGISGVVDEHAGTIRETSARGSSINSSWLKVMVGKAFGVSAFVYNDASLAALGEKKIGIKDEETRNLIYMYADLGCGIIIDGQIYLGSRGLAGEMQLNMRSEIPYSPNIEEDRLHYLNTIGPALGIVEKAKRLFKEGQDSEVYSAISNNPDNITLELIISSAMKGDAVSMSLLKEAGVNLGVKAAYLINLFDPDVVVIGGGIEKAGEMVLGPVKKMVRSLTFGEFSRSPRIIPSILGEDAVSVGALAMAVENTLIKS